MKTERIDGRKLRPGALRSALAAWYAGNRRDLPWRRTDDPYAIWVSEIMLQQTTVAAVIPYWERFVARFPDVRALAAADEDDVLASWAGLGYYRRARSLHAAARTLVAAGRGSLPRSVAGLRALPGIGEYTAAAIASIAFGIAEPVLDGNVVRVLARLLGERGEPTRAAVRRRLLDVARALLDPAAPGETNQALMELGATVCTPRAPDCPACPWRGRCVARRDGLTGELPRRPARRASITVVRAAARVRRRDGRLLLVRIRDGRANAGLWELPTATLFHGERDPGPAPTGNGRALAGAAREAWRRELDLALETDGRVAARCQHAITHHRITVHLFEARFAGRSPRRRDLLWWDPATAAPGLTAATRRLLAAPGPPARGRLDRAPSV